MKQVVTLEEAVGFPLAHDITEIRPGEFKGAAFHKGHILKQDDLEHLRRLGKNNLYIIKTTPAEMHEDEAAEAMAGALCGPGVGWQEAPREGKISLKATLDGLFKVDVEALMEFNLHGEVMCATRHTNTMVKAGDIVAATRAIPLIVARKTVEAAIAAAGSTGVLTVTPLRQPKVGIMITGNEVFYGLIKDKFKPIITQKVLELGGEVLDTVFLPDDETKIAEATAKMAARGADVLITTGGMSVDPDDRTRHALTRAGVTDIVYGTPVLPGAMFMVAYLGDIPVLGIPACGMYAARTVLDLVFPRILAGERITRRAIAELGHGGLCLQCKTCTYPVCPFGK
ncbi:MAG: molybdopterin-binding protein [Desulfobacterales bacterium GWB2_56_26]|nr:MAG: molybdopterin-binding protein [Desulfobacterales bacterium GWB2_56_26]